MSVLGVGGIVWALLSAFGWSALDASRKHLVAKMDAVAVVVLVSIGQLPMFGWWWWYEGGTIVETSYWLPATCSVVLNVVANLLFMYAVKHSALSLTVPLLSFVPVFTVALAAVVLAQMPGPWQLVGIVAVVIGAVFLGASGVDRSSSRQMIQDLIRSRGSLPMIGVALCWSSTIVIDKLATERAAVPLHGFVVNAGIGIALLLWLLARGRGAQIHGFARAPLSGFLAIVFNAVGFGAQLVAVQTVHVGLIEAVKRSVGLVMAVVLGRILFHEPVTAGKLLSIALMAAGSVAIVWL